MVMQNFRQAVSRLMNGASQRNYWAIFGWPQSITTDDYWRRYRRGGISTRIIRAYPDACWRGDPVIQDEQGISSTPGPEYSAFTDAWESLNDQLQCLSYLRRVDRLSRVGHFAILLLGFDDGGDLSAPAPQKANLSYLAAYSENSAKIIEWGMNPNEPRYGLPIRYQISPKSDQSQSSHSIRRSHFTVHWTRVLHIAENLDEDEVFGEPALRPVWNTLLDLEKLLGSSAETFWLNARGGITVEVHPDAKLGKEEIDGMKSQMDDYINDIRRDLAFQGAKVGVLSTTTSDPSPQFEIYMAVINGTTGIPKRILTGSEQGELASSEDANSFNARVDERCRQHCDPNILRPFIQLMIMTGNLPQPVGRWFAEWQESSALSEEKQVKIGSNRIKAMKEWADSGADRAMALPEARIAVGLPPQSEYDLEMEDEDTLGDDLLPGDLDAINPDPDPDPEDDDEGGQQ